MTLVLELRKNPLRFFNLRLMATASPHSNLHVVSTRYFPRGNKPLPFFTLRTSYFRTKRKLLNISSTKTKQNSFANSNSASVDEFPSNENEYDNNTNPFEIFRNLVGYIQPVLPGGSWWNLSDAKQAENTTAKPVTVWLALSRMWDLIGHDKWLVYVAVASLIVAAVSEISMPSILAEAIFSAQRGEAMVFSNSTRLLVLLCVSSGIFSGMRSGCFSIANTTLVNCLRETLYSALVFQEISFFDTEPVGGLTSGLGADCQRLSNVIGNNIHLILRNSLQGTGAFVNLLTLSWPLTLSALVICSLLSLIFSIYGQYQKKAAELSQDLNACASDAAQETLSMMQTVRVYGTEQKELGRYKIWLEKLAFIGIRETVAYGFWNMSFITLYRCTQVWKNAQVLGFLHKVPWPSEFLS